MKRILFFLLIICCGPGLRTLAQSTVVRFTVDCGEYPAGLDIPESLNLDPVCSFADSSLTLYELSVSGNRRAVSFQLERGEHRWLHWMVKTGNIKEHSHQFELVASSTGTRAPSEEMIAHVGDSAVTIGDGGQNLLRYWTATVYPPAGVDSAFRRSGFIHPLWTPHGQELTRIQAPDHRHHYGLWNPWTHVLFENDTVDFWNLGSKKGTVRFKKLLSINNGPVYSEISVLHEHVVLHKDGTEKIAMNEVQTIRAWRPDKKGDYYFLDITSQLNCASDSPVLLLTYRYGGLGWRTTAVWNKNNSEVLTSEGKDRKTADGTKAKWCIVQGSLDSTKSGKPGDMGEYGGVVMLSYPTNYNYPEPLRIWPENQNGRGDMFANFDPTKDRDWLLEPGKTYTLKYRLVVFNGKFDKGKAESAWFSFAAPPVVKVLPNQ